MVVWLPVHCPHGQSIEVIKHGKSAEGKQPYCWKCQMDKVTANVSGLAWQVIADSLLLGLHATAAYSTSW